MTAKGSAHRGRALVLDFGGVISRTLFETHDRTERALGLAAGTLAWRGPFDPEGDALWRAMQADEIGERDYWLARTREVGQQLGERWDRMETFVRRARGDDIAAILRPEAVAAIAAARAGGCRLAVLSNELDLFYGEGFAARLPLLAGFDAVIDASHGGPLKPDARAYAACEAALELPGAACVFVDDQWRNVRGAQRAGWQAVHFDVTRPQASFDAALALLGLAPAAAPSDNE